MRSKHELKCIWSALETVLHSRSHLIAYAFLAFIAFIAFGAGASAAAFFIAFFAMMFWLLDLRKVGDRKCLSRLASLSQSHDRRNAQQGFTSVYLLKY